MGRLQTSPDGVRARTSREKWRTERLSGETDTDEKSPSRHNHEGRAANIIDSHSYGRAAVERVDGSEREGVVAPLNERRLRVLIRHAAGEGVACAW